MLTWRNLKPLTLLSDVYSNQDATRALATLDFLKRHKFKEGVIDKVAIAFLEAATEVCIFLFVSRSLF